ncbi:MAG: hypothetical protein MJ246_00885 [Clostridia bacterium]|nr:hypothetical protein [Clostridia bacterium]
MYGKMLNTIINIMFITYLLLLVSFYFLHEGIKSNINNINYSTVDVACTTGVFSIETYNNLKEKVIMYGGNKVNYVMTIKYERKVSPGVYDTYFIKDVINTENASYPDIDELEPGTTIKVRDKVDPNKIITDTGNKQVYPLQKGDIITIYLEDQNQTLYGKLITMPFMGLLGDYTDFRIKSLKSSMVGRNASALYTGQEVKQDINDASRTYNILIKTEASTNLSSLTAGFKTYAPGEKYDETAHDDEKAAYGTPTTTIGTFHIFDMVSFYRVWDDLNVSGTCDAGDTVTYYQTVD